MAGGVGGRLTGGSGGDLASMMAFGHPAAHAQHGISGLWVCGNATLEQHFGLQVALVTAERTVFSGSGDAAAIEDGLHSHTGTQVQTQPAATAQLPRRASRPSWHTLASSYLLPPEHLRRHKDRLVARDRPPAPSACPPSPP